MKIYKSTSFALMLGVATIGLISCNSKSSQTAADTAAADSVPPAPVSARPVHWSYSGEEGPSAWSTLSPVYSLCGDGKSQSPINISKTDVRGGVNWKLDYKTTSL